MAKSPDEQVTEGIGFIDTSGWGDSFEPEHLADGEEVEVQVVDAGTQMKKSGEGQVLALRLNVVGKERVDDIYHYASIPDNRMKADEVMKWNRAVKALEAMALAFDVSTEGGLNLNDLQGASGWIVVRLEEDPVYGQRNSVRSFTVRR